LLIFKIEFNALLQFSITHYAVANADAIRAASVDAG